MGNASRVGNFPHRRMFKALILCSLVVGALGQNPTFFVWTKKFGKDSKYIIGVTDTDNADGNANPTLTVERGMTVTFQLPDVFDDTFWIVNIAGKNTKIPTGQTRHPAAVATTIVKDKDNGLGAKGKVILTIPRDTADGLQLVYQSGTDETEWGIINIVGAGQATGSSPTFSPGTSVMQGATVEVFSDVSQQRGGHICVVKLETNDEAASKNFPAVPVCTLFACVANAALVPQGVASFTVTTKYLVLKAIACGSAIPSSLISVTYIVPLPTLALAPGGTSPQVSSGQLVTLQATNHFELCMNEIKAPTCNALTGKCAVEADKVTTDIIVRKEGYTVKAAACSVGGIASAESTYVLKNADPPRFSPPDSSEIKDVTDVSISSANALFICWTLGDGALKPKCSCNGDVCDTCTQGNKGTKVTITAAGPGTVLQAIGCVNSKTDKSSEVGSATYKIAPAANANAAAAVVQGKIVLEAEVAQDIDQFNPSVFKSAVASVLTSSSPKITADSVTIIGISPASTKVTFRIDSFNPTDEKAVVGNLLANCAQLAASIGVKCDSLKSTTGGVTDGIDKYGGPIVGIILGSFAGIAIIFAAFYFCFVYRPKVVEEVKEVETIHYQPEQLYVVEPPPAVTYLPTEAIGYAAAPTPVAYHSYQQA